MRLSGRVGCERSKYRGQIWRLVDLGIHGELEPDNCKDSYQPENKELDYWKKAAGKV